MSILPILWRNPGTGAPKGRGEDTQNTVEKICMTQILIHGRELQKLWFIQTLEYHPTVKDTG